MGVHLKIRVIKFVVYLTQKQESFCPTKSLFFFYLSVLLRIQCRISSFSWFVQPHTVHRADQCRYWAVPPLHPPPSLAAPSGGH